MLSGKRAANEVIDRLTGHSIVSTATMKGLQAKARLNEANAKKVAQELKEVAAQKRQAAALVKRLEGQVSRIEALTKPKPKAPAKMPNDYDPLMEEIWPRIKDRTMTSPQKTNTLIETVRYIQRCAIPGDIVECGVWRGGSMLAVVEVLLRLGVTDRKLHLFDTYTGMAEPGERDVHIHHGLPAGNLLNRKVGGARIWEAASVEDVQAGFAALDYPAENLHFIAGKVEDTIPEHAPEQIALLRLDTDWYESTKHEFEHLYGRLAPGGVLIIDDYGSWQGSKDATDEFVDSTGEPLMLVRVDRGRVAIKPGLTSRVPGLSVASAG